LRRADGEYRWVLDHGVPRHAQDGVFLGYIGSCLDIADRKRAEEERAGLLEREKAAREQAENANRIKDEFLATLSHELRTPLQAILGFSKLLVMGRLDREAAGRAIETIQRNAQAQASLIEDLLDVSRIVTGKLLMDIRPQDLTPLAEAAVESLRPAAAGKGVTLSKSIDPQLGLVPVDANRIQQAIWNLLSNAVKFTPRGGQILLQVAQAGSSVRITVTDTGIGIPPEFLPHVFDPFRQAQSSISRSLGGLGLGLSIVRHIVEMHGGTVEVESAGVGRGAAFRIDLPLRSLQVPAIDVSRVARLDVTREFPPGLLENVSVLVVDDELDSRDLLTIALRQHGATVITADSAGAALDILQNDPWPDVLVSDLGMPGEDGFSLIRKVRALRKNAASRIPAIALTGYAMDSDRSRTKEAGFQMHVAKPVDPAVLVQAVAQVAGRLSAGAT
jgi:signal transduction histidine kinase/CheY-like chemotaxis protein